MTVEEAKEGDVVYLKSGGPAMVVTDSDLNSRRITTKWFTLEGDVRWDIFPAVCLTVVKPKDFVA